MKSACSARDNREDGSGVGDGIGVGDVVGVGVCSIIKSVGVRGGSDTGLSACLVQAAVKKIRGTASRNNDRYPLIFQRVRILFQDHNMSSTITQANSTVNDNKSDLINRLLFDKAALPC